MTPQDRLGAALASADGIDDHALAGAILAADPTIAADMELGRRIRGIGLLLAGSILDGKKYPSETVNLAIQLRAALTEGEQ
jgi:hypothetical protein